MITLNEGINICRSQAASILDRVGICHVVYLGQMGEQVKWHVEVGPSTLLQHANAFKWSHQ